MKEKGRKRGRKEEERWEGGQKGSLLSFKQLLGAKNIN